MTKYVKFISETVAAEAPTHKNGQPYTVEMAIEDGFLPLETVEPDASITIPVPNYRVIDGKVVQIFVQGEEPKDLDDRLKDLEAEHRVIE